MESVIILTAIFLLLIVLTGYLTASEIAISSYGENRIEELKEKNIRLSEVFLKILKDPEPFYGSLHLLKYSIMICAALIVFQFFILLIHAKFSGSFVDNGSWNKLILPFLLALIISSVLLIIFGYLIPKVIGYKHSKKIGEFSVKILYPVSIILYYPVKLLMSIGNFLLLPTGEKTNFSKTYPSEEEILGLISDGVESGTIDEKEGEIIANVFEFNDLKANEVMIPRTEMVAIDSAEDQEIIISKVMKTGHSLIPVYEDSPDNISGVIHVKDFLRQVIEEEKFPVKNFIRPAYFIPETKLISEVLTEMQQQGERLAVVTDEYGGTEGVITMEDILEEIVGEIKDKHSTSIKEYSKLPDDKYYILGSMQIDDFNETFNHKLPESDEYNTVAGFVADNASRILNIGESTEFEDMKFELIKKIRQKMVQFKVSSGGRDFREMEEDSSKKENKED